MQLTPHSSCQEFDWQFLFIYILLYNICLNAVNFSDWNFTVSAWIFIDHKIICTTCYTQSRHNGCRRNHLTGSGYQCPGNGRCSDAIFMALCITKNQPFELLFCCFPKAPFWNTSKSLVLVSYQQLRIDPCKLPHLQLFTIEKSHLHKEMWCFHNCSLIQPARELFGSFSSSETTFFYIFYFWHAETEAENFCPQGKNCETLSQLGVPILPSEQSYFFTFLFFLYNFRYTAFQYLQWMQPPFPHENTHPMPAHHIGVFLPASSQCNTPPNPARTRTPWYSHPPLFCLLLFLFNKNPDLVCSFLYKCHTS